MDETSRPKLTRLGRNYYHPGKCLNCDAPVTLLQNLLDPGMKLTTDYYVDVLTYIFGLQQADTGTLLLKHLNINEFTFCKPCTQLLTAMRTVRQKFIHQTKTNAYLYHVVLSKKRKGMGTESPTTDTNERLTETLNSNLSGVPGANKTQGNQVQPVHVVIDDDLEIVGQSNTVLSNVLARAAGAAEGPAPILPSVESSSQLPLPNTIKGIPEQAKKAGQEKSQRYSVLQVMLQAVASSSTGMLSVKGIQHHIIKNYPQYDACRQEWHDALLVMLQKSDYFTEVCPQTDPTTSPSSTSFWKMNPKYETVKLVQAAFKVQPNQAAAVTPGSSQDTSVEKNRASTPTSAASFPKSDLVITSVTSIAEPSNSKSSLTGPFVTEVGSSSGSSVSSRKRTIDTIDQTQINVDEDGQTRKHPCEKSRRLTVDTSLNSPEMILPDTPTSSDSRSSDVYPDPSQGPPSKAKAKEGMSQNQRLMQVKSSGLIAGLERINSPEFEVVSSDDDEISVNEIVKNDSPQTKKQDKAPSTDAKTKSTEKLEDGELEIISSDEDIGESETKINKESKSAKLQVQNEADSENPNSINPNPVDLDKEKLRISIKQPSCDDTAELLAETMPNIEPRLAEGSKCKIKMIGVSTVNSSTAIAEKGLLIKPKIAVRTDLFENYPETPEGNAATQYNAAAETVTPAKVGNFMLVDTPKELQMLKTIMVASFTAIREEMKQMQDNLNGLEDKCSCIQPNYMVNTNIKESSEEEKWSGTFLDIMKNTKCMTDIIQRTFLMLDQLMIRIRVLGPPKLMLNDADADYKPHGTLSIISVTALSKYFKIAIRAEDYIKSPDYKDFLTILQILKYKVVRIIKHFTPKDASQQNVTDSYFYNICNYLKAKENPDPGTKEKIPDDWCLEKAIRVWDQIKLFRDPINVDIVNLDHSVQGVAGFEDQLTKIEVGVQKRKQVKLK